MKRLLTIFAPLLLAVTLHASTASAWEAATTHAGLTEQSALSSDLHKRLQEQFGSAQGLYTLLAVPKGDAPQLFEIVSRLNPTHGYVPDASGRMTALSWLVLGSVVADVPAAHARNHFFDPLTGDGLTNSTESGLSSRARLAIERGGRGPSLKAGGRSAQAWWQAADNPLGYEGFATQFRKAVSAQTAGERSRHLAGSLVATGAMLHILQDMGSPSRVRDDIRSHQQQVGSSASDRGSRFERIAALAFGRLGIPGAAKAPALAARADFFSNQEGTGLADVTSRQYFSANTLPKRFSVTRNTGNTAFRAALDSHLRRPSPSSSSGKFGSRFDLVAARNDEGATWQTDSGACLAQYHLRKATVEWSISDDCALEQLEEILPQVAGYGISFLESLYPSDLKLESASGKLAVKLNEARYGAGKLVLFTEAADGLRTEYYSADLTGTETQVVVPSPPAGSTRVSALFDGKDVLGTALLASDSSPWPLP